MGERFEVQARLVRRRGTTVLCDESRTVRTISLPEAIAQADDFVAQGFTTWIYRLEPGSGISLVHRLVRRLYPTSAEMPEHIGRPDRCGPSSSQRGTSDDPSFDGPKPCDHPAAG